MREEQGRLRSEDVVVVEAVCDLGLQGAGPAAGGWGAECS